MDKKKNITIGVVIIFVVLIAVIIIMEVNMSNSDKSKNATNESTMTAEREQVETTLTDEEYPTVPEHTDDKNLASTNYFDNVEIIEETTKKSKKKKKKKETEAYAGEEDGWSPLVSPDDLEQ